ncbi:MAG TPA: ParB/RepB/Spo0J family partition protein [Nitrososphaeraceae archaeon]|nr:ParB/RepB/Spo0J family partition protein [Nitrososphaeraceae archaeon]
MSKLPSNSLLMSGIIDDINISQIKEGHNPRKQVVVPDVEELAASIQQKGLLQPILVRTIVEEEAEGYFEIIAGNRRFHACKRLGWNKIPCHIIELDDKQAFEVSLIENLQRKTLGPLDEAIAFKAYVSDFGWGGVSELSLKIGKSISYIIKRIKLLNLPIDIQNSIINHTLDTSTAEELFVIKDKTRQSAVASLVANRRLSLKKTREILKDLKRKDDDYYMDFDSSYKSEYIDHIKVAERSFDKTITTLKIAMNSLREIITNVEDDWILYEVLMQHKNMIHAQIDILIKEKRKLK